MLFQALGWYLLSLMTVPANMTSSSSSRTPRPQAMPMPAPRSLKVQRRYGPQSSGVLMFVFVFFRLLFTAGPLHRHSQRLSHPFCRLKWLLVPLLSLDRWIHVSRMSLLYHLVISTDATSVCLLIWLLYIFLVPVVFAVLVFQRKDSET